MPRSKREILNWIIAYFASTLSSQTPTLSAHILPWAQTLGAEVNAYAALVTIVAGERIGVWSLQRMPEFHKAFCASRVEATFPSLGLL